jgi:hypothetical protein
MSEANFARLSTARKLALTNWRGCSHRPGRGRTLGTYHNKDALSRHEGTRPGFGDTLAPTFFRPWATHGALQRTHLLEVAVRIGSALLVIWLIIGAIAGAQRHYYSGNISSCTKASTIIVTILAGPLNYVGVNPKVVCHVPQPSGS